MINTDKTFTDNPFVDNVIYYAKYLAMNCSIKDEEEALANETKQTLEDGDILIACVENTSNYEMFKSIPKEIIEKYIPIHSNLDLFVDSEEMLKIHLNHYSLYERTKLLNNLSRIAREVYVDHYLIMTKYIEQIGPTWLDDNKLLYDKCKDGSATYKDLFDIMPTYTKKRIIKQYLNNYDLSKIDNISESLSNFEDYIDTRTDVQIETELANISKAMREVFSSHYEIIDERKYINQGYNRFSTFINNSNLYKKCKSNIASYKDLFKYFPKEELIEVLNNTLGSDNVDRYALIEGVEAIDYYFDNISEDSDTEKAELSKNMREVYLSNYQFYLNNNIYLKCNMGLCDYFDLIDYIPRETKKMILNTQFDEYTNVEVYAENKTMLNSYLNTIPKNEADYIKNAINIDMREWYPKNHVEYNNYYRSLIGLPPVGKDNKPYEDTLIHSWDPLTNSYKEFGNKFIKQLPTELYPEIHWKQNIYEFDAYDIGILNEYGILEDYVKACGTTINDPRYKYLRYLADNKLNLYDCRKALKFQLIGIPTIDDEEARKRFIDCYAINRDYCLRTVYSDAHKYQSDYYDKFMIIFIIINTIMDMLSDITTMIINREVFDSRCIKWLFESFGVPYYSEIPIKYLRAMLKNLNLLLKYKSSVKNMIDICNLFGFSDVKVFDYYLFRKRCIDSNTGEYEFEENNDISYDLNDLWVKDVNGETEDYNGIKYTKLLEYRNYDEEKYTKLIKYEENGEIKSKRIIKNDIEVYVKDPENDEFMLLTDTQYFTKVKAETKPAELKFIKVPVNDDLTKYKNDNNYLVYYDEVTLNDEGNTWDGGLVHDYLYQKLVDHNFNAAKTKYISIETVTDLTEQCFQVSYFYNMLFDNLYSEDTLTLKIPYLKVGHEFKFMDIICYLFALMYFYNDLEDNIMYSPTQILYVKGYNFDQALNEIMNDPKAFTQEPNLADRENIFDINRSIAEDNYNYREAFSDYGIKSFNLEADIDELEKWLNDYCQMSLDDFVVDDTLTTFSQIITLRQFFTLNNSYYQKDIFKNNVSPLPYNQNIKSAYNAYLYEKIFKNDLDGIEHSYITEDGKIMEVINNLDDTIYIMNYSSYIEMPNHISHTLLTKYKKQSNGNYNKASYQYYYYNKENNSIERLFDNNIYVVDKNNRYIFATDAIYTKDEEDIYTEVTDEKYFVKDKYEPDRKRLLFGSYWIKNSNGIWVLDPEQAYVWVEVNGEGSYVKWTEATNHQNIVVSEDDCWIKHSDGHFIKYTETDYYRQHHKDGDNTIYELDEEICYVETTTATDEEDTDINGVTRYFKKLKDFYFENNWIYQNDLYIYDELTKTYIAEKDLLSPNNCYFKISDDMYALVINNYANYKNYSNNNYKASYLLILQEDNDYSRLKLKGQNYVIDKDPTKRYILNSDNEYITVLDTEATYDETKSMIVVFNREVTSSNVNQLEGTDKYNPEITDRVWDENDWFYDSNDSNSNKDIGMNGENIWYYIKPGSPIIPPDEDEKQDPVGSGFYMESTAYIGDIHLEKGKKYYMAFDIETNFTGSIQIYNTADDSVKSINNRIYEVNAREQKHINQIFIANEIETPEIRFLIYDFKNYTIRPGDYIIISNIRFIRAYSDNFIAQDIPSYDKLQELYRTNEAIYKYLVSCMAKETDLYKYNIYKKIYDSLMISKYNKEAFKIGDNKYAKTYTEFLSTRDAVLYSKLIRFKTLDKDTMHKEIADEIIEVTYAIDDCVDTYTYGFLYSYFPAVSANYIQQYITKLINWFKSWKVHLLGINTIYKLGDEWENTVKILEDQEYKMKFDHFKHNVYIHDTVKINPIDDTNISGEKYSELYDIDEPTNTYKDSTPIKDRVRIISTYSDKIEYYDSNTQLRLKFNSNDIEVNVKDSNNLNIKSSNAGFSTSDDNNLVMTTEENEQQPITNQVIDEINKYSSDYIDWRNILNE